LLGQRKSPGIRLIAGSRELQRLVAASTIKKSTGSPSKKFRQMRFALSSFIERLNLTIRQGSAYLCKRTICHARWKERLEDHLEFFRCYYNFIRPHRALKLGLEIRTPAMQAGLVSKRLTFRRVFVAVPERILFVIVFIEIKVNLS
jgi:hypothetical protein